MTTPVITPRLRMTRAPLYYDRNSQIASTSHTGGPSRLTEFSQLVDVDLNDMELPGSSDPSNHSNLSTPSTATRSEKPAAVLRALLSRLPADHRSLTPSQSLPQQYPSERESDYETSEPANATPSMAQESLKDIFFKARRDPGNTPQKIRARRNSVSTSEVDASFSVEEERPDSKGKRRSVSDDEAEHLDKSFNRRTTRFKPSPQPVTMEFLRERFSDSQISHMPENSSPSIHNSSNVTATLWRDLNSSHATPPAATSTPQQSLRMSINSQFQSNLLDHDTEMRHAIEDLDFNGESTNPSISPPPTVRSRNLAEIRATSSDGINGLHYTPRESNFKCDPNWNKPQFLNEGSHFSAHSLANMSPTEPEAFHLKSRGQSPLEIEHFRGHRYSPGDKDRKPATQTRFEPILSKGARLSPIPHENLNLHGSLSSFRPNSPDVSTQSRDDDPGDPLYGRERNCNSPHSTWPDHSSGHSPSHGHPHAPVGSSAQSHISSPTISQNLTEAGYEPPIRSLSPFYDEQASPTPSRTSSLENIHRHRDANHPSSPFLSFSQKNLHSTDKSMNSVEPPTTLSKPKLPRSPSFDQSSRAVTPPIRQILTQTQTQPNVSHTKPLTLMELMEGQNARQRIIEENDTDDLRETDFSQSEVHDTEIDDVQSHSTQPTRALSPFSLPPNTPQILPEDRTALRDGFTRTSSPSTPSRRSTPKSSRREFKTPSPPKNLPDLPTPSSSDESEPKPWKQARPPDGAKGHQDYAWMATPKPPGGWLQTPGPSHARQDLDGTSPMSSAKVSDEISPDPTTPARAASTAQQTKTPKPPGGWLSSPSPKDTSISPQPEKAQGLFTPLPSLSKGTSIDLKTPAVPGAWGVTPASRRSILKVRFEPETPATQNGSRWSEQANEELAATAIHSVPRKSKVPHTPSIRVVDAFGREQETNVSTHGEASRSQKKLRVVDAMGQEIQETGDTADQNQVEHLFQPSSRTELLSRIRRGLDDLVVDLDDVNDDDAARTADRDRMAELNAISMRARRNRQSLYSKRLPVELGLNPLASDSRSSFQLNHRVYFIVLFLQLLLFLLMYRLSVNRARELFLNSYYDPFNPELHLYIFKYDTSLPFSDSTPDQTIGDVFLQKGGKFWYDWLSFMGHIQNSVWEVWRPDATSQSSAWSPT